MTPRWIKIKCQHAHELISARMDAPLSPLDRLRLWVHLGICEMCARVDRQMSFMRQAIRRLDK